MRSITMLVFAVVFGSLHPNEVAFGVLISEPQSATSIADKSTKTSETTKTRTPDSALPKSKAVVPDANFVSFKNMGVRIKRPKGFVLSDSFDGFHNHEGASVLLVRMKGSWKETGAGFQDPALLKKNRMKLISKKDITLSGLSGILVEIEQSVSGLVFRKFVACFGDDQQTRMVMATFPKGDSDSLRKSFKDVVETIQVIAIDESQTNVGFTVDSGGLKLTKAVSFKGLMYTEDGVIPQTDPADPLFMAMPSFGNVRATSWPNDGVKKQFTMKGINQLPNTKVTEVLSTKPVQIDGWSGFETVAEARRTDKDDIELQVYQVILFGDRDYFRMVGIVGRNGAEEYIPRFTAIAKSLKRDNVKSTSAK